jgi:hypothetical protein
VKEVVMPLPKLTAAGVVSLLLVSVCFAQGQYGFDKAVYIKPVDGSKGQPVQGVLRFDSTKKEVQFVDTGGTPVLSVKYDAIKGLLFEDTAKPRYAASLVVPPLVFTKSKKHYLTIDYLDTAGTPRYAIIHLDKSNSREALARAESETGKKAERP